MLSANNISFSVGQLPLLSGVSFDVQPGELMTIIGANGAGKSTLLKIASGAQKATSGTMTIQDKALTDWKVKELSQFTAVLHQQTVLTLPFSVSDVVMMGRYPHFKNHPCPLDHTIVANAIKKAGIQELTERNYLGLSGGEQQRVHLARVFAQIWFSAHYQVRYLMMDEPSNNLDIRHQHHILAMAREFAAEGNCVVAVLHDLNLAMQYADKILLLKKGKALAFGDVQDILTEPLITEAYDFPIHIINHATYDFPIVMPGVRKEISI